MALEIRRHLMRRYVLSITSLAVLLIVVFFLSISVGVVGLGLKEVVGYFLGATYDPLLKSILELRITRTLASALTGASLAVAGVLIQGVTRNPLAEPYILGISSTALSVTSLVLMVKPSLINSRTEMMLYSFLGALLGFTFTLMLSRLGSSGLSLVLAGVAVTSISSGISHILLYLLQSVLRMPYVYLLMGSVSPVLKSDLPILTSTSVLCILASLLIAKPLNAYVYGDEYSKQLGFNPRLTLLTAATIASILTGITVGVVGIVGFVGLASPHICRYLIGSDHRFSLPTSALVGATLVVFSDIVVRTVSVVVRGLGELPLGVITAVIGAPFLAYLVLRRVRE
ncbi:MAG: iron ABC transporter permease [Sulfolobales archaeon]